MTPAEAASPAPVYIGMALLLLALMITLDWLDTAPIDPPWAEDDDSDDGP